MTTTDFQDAAIPEHAHPLSRPDLYNYSDISQNGGNMGQIHYDNLVWYRSLLLDNPRPINHVKTYRFTWPTGAEYRDRREATDKEAADRFWRSILGGAASCRHHRRNPNEWHSGIGLTSYGQTHLRSMRMLLDAMWIFAMAPRNDLLSQREENEAYCLAEPGKQYAVFFTGEGDRLVELDLGEISGNVRVRWLNIMESNWEVESVVASLESGRLECPREGQWVVLIQKVD
jgi:hypothetical protein